MKNNFSKNPKYVDFFLLICIILFIMSMFFSCGKADIVISRDDSVKNSDIGTENTISDGMKIIINISSGVFHADENCRYVSAMKDENKKIITCRDIALIIEDGYKPCSYCASQYKTKNGGTDG